jgi:acetyl/propionyl-CoA carboxylase alpha subunit/acetyl-CoA carboxylase carboxyltransferase component
MKFPPVLIANRGEIAVRIAAAAAELGLETVAVHSRDDAEALHVRRADRAVALDASGPAAYLDIQALLAAASAAGAGAVHPGYGFLAENAGFAEACEDAGLVFVGPTPETLRACGDKSRARELAVRLGVPVLEGTSGATSLEEARAFLESLGPGARVMVKAIAGGGGRGMRPAGSPEELEDAFARSASEAARAFGNDALYVERLVPEARHVEVQIVGDGRGTVAALGDRECTLQRGRQKLVEIAPVPGLATTTRAALAEAALRMAGELDYRGVGTFEFLLDAADPTRFVFLEVNARLQVEHTVTEAVTGIDLVHSQLRIAAGATLAELGLAAGAPPSRGFAVQARINMERMEADGTARPTGGTIALFEAPAGPGLRTDTFATAGATPSPAFDSLLAKVIAHGPDLGYAATLAKLDRALHALRIEGIATNREFLLALLAHEDVRAHRVHTTWIEEHLPELLAALAENGPDTIASATAANPGLAGARIDSRDPLAVLDHGRARDETRPGPGTAGNAREGFHDVHAPLQGTIVSVDVAAGTAVSAGQCLIVMEAMKMEHVIAAPVTGRLDRLHVAAGDTVFEGHLLASLEQEEGAGEERILEEQVDLDRIRPDLAEVRERHAFGLDENREEAVARRRSRGMRTARENIEDLCDPGTFHEYGALVLAAQRRRRDLDDLIRKTPGDGLVGGLGHVGGDAFGPERSRCIAVSYDYMVLAGTQGLQNHRKKDRLFDIAREQRLPVVIFTEGGGGRPGDTDGTGVAGLDCLAFQYFARLSGLVPLVGVNAGRCFAGNAALLGCCDVIIATEDSNIGMGGPAMIEGGGLGIFRPEEVGPIDVQTKGGVVDVAVRDEAEAVAVAKKYLSYFQGNLSSWEAADQRLLRSVIPENRLRIYDVRRVIETMADAGSVLELRRGFGPGMVTALARIEGRPIGIVANNPAHLAGAIDPDGADKASRFMQLCDAFDLPLLFLCDTPGIMVGPEIEKKANVRHAARMFVTGASLSVPFFTIVLRKGYGLGAQAMAGGSFHAPLFTVAWPTGEFGGMGLEGAVKLGFRNELAAIEDPEERRRTFEEMVARMYEVGKAVNMASHFEIDGVIDPMESRSWVLAALRAAPTPLARAGKKRPFVDTW